MVSPLSYAARAQRYAEQVVAGKIIASRLTISACKRHLEDLKISKISDPDFPFYYDEASANRICGFVELFPHIKGAWARSRELIKLEDWQCFILCVAFGWLELGTNMRRFRTVYIEVPRKNAKTTLSVPVALYMQTADGEQGAEIIAAATKKDQAGISFSIAQSMVRKSEAFRTEFGVQARAHSIICLETDSTFKPIDSRGSTQDGANLHFSLNDELHAWKGRDLYAVLETAMGSRAQPMMWNITTAGNDHSGICYEQRQYLENILNKGIRDERFFGIIYTIDEGDDIYDELTHRKANPNYGISVLPQDMRALANKARNNPKSRADFRMKRLNVWVGAAEAYFDMDALSRCVDTSLCRSDFVDEDSKVGLDLASKRDINAGINLFERNGHYYCFSDFWLPRAAIESGANASYRGWEEQGLLRITEGDVVDYQAIEDTIKDDYAVEHVISEIAFDPFQATHLIRRLMDEGFTCVEVRPVVLNFSEPMKTLDALIASGHFHYDGNPILTWMFSNVVAVKDHKDNVYPRKRREENKIDGVIALLQALSRALVNKPQTNIGKLIADGVAIM